MLAYSEMSKDELKKELEGLKKDYEEICKKNISLDMSRGKPGKEQLDLSMDMLDVLTSESDVHASNGIDCRNYGVLGGIPEAKKMMADIMGTTEDHVIIYGNASLNIMYDSISRAYSHGVLGCTPWCKLDKVKWLCPVPGYDRHFAITEYFGIEMINIPMNADGPDMDMIEKLVAEDDSIKGIWCVPKYSNPTGISYSDEVVKRMAALKPAAKDFRIIYDNAYCVHDLNEHGDTLLNIFNELPKYQHEDMVIMVASTSKISFAGAGVSCIVASENNIVDIKKRLTIQSISQDKMNQLRHLNFFKDVAGLKAHMKKQAVLLKPKFDCVIEHLNNELGGKGIASWIEPNGGYFISLDVMPGCAKRIGELCKDAGVVLTTIGATYPYGIDPQDTNIRIAPSYPSVDELSKAAELLCICVQLACLEKLLK